MSEAILFYTVLYLLSFGISQGIIIYAWRHHTVSGAIPTILTSIGIAIWSCSKIISLFYTDLPTLLFWANIQNIGVVLLPAGALTFVLQYTGRDQWLSKKTWGYLTIEPIIYQCLIWTDSIHGLMRATNGLDHSGPFPVHISTFAIGYWLHTAYSYGLIIVSLILLLQQLAKSSHRLYRGQNAALIISITIPFLANFIQIMKLNPLPYLALTPLALTITNIVFAWAIYRYRLLDLVPMAQEVVLNNIRDGIIVLDLQGRILDINSVAQRTIHLESSESIGRFLNQMMPTWQPFLNGPLEEEKEELYQTNLLDSGQQTFELRIFPFYNRYHVLTGRLLVLHNITDKRRAEEKLQASEEWYRTLVETIPYGIEDIDTSGMISLANSAHHKQYEYDTGELTGMSVFDLVAFDDERQEMKAYLKHCINEQPEPTPYFGKRRTKTGRIIDVQVTWDYKRDSQKHVTGIISVISDITELKKAEEERRRTNQRLLTHQSELRSLTLELVRTEERERRRIATVLHDGINQHLAMLNIKLDALHASISDSVHNTAIIELHDMINELIQRTRTLTFELIPPILYQLGFEAAVEWLTEQFQSQHHISCTVEADENPAPLSDDLRTMLYFILRELLFNAAKHAQAEQVKVTIEHDEETIQIGVMDDGIGFDYKKDTTGNGFGLFSIRERVEALDGLIQVDSTIGHGTRITLAIPLQQGVLNAHNSIVGR